MELGCDSNGALNRGWQFVSRTRDLQLTKTRNSPFKPPNPAPAAAQGYQVSSGYLI